MSWSEHESVNEYVAARERGDSETAARIVREVGARFATRTTDGSEAADLMLATWTTRLGEKREG